MKRMIIIKFQKLYNFNTVKEFIEVTSKSNCKLLETEYIDYTTKMRILCPCGNEFKTSFNKFKNRNKRQCNTCGREKTRLFFLDSYKDVKEEIESKTTLKLLTIENEYVDKSTKMHVKCECGSKFKVSYHSIFTGNQNKCNKCSKKKSDNKKRFPYKYVKYLVEKNGCKLLSRQYKNTKDKLILECACGNIFSTSLEIVKTYNKFHCTSCGHKNKKLSLLEENIKNYLDLNNINYKREYSFSDCIYKGELRFDFAIFDNFENLLFLIEADGIQHFKPFEYYGGEDNFEIIKLRDSIKDNYCLKRNIKLIRIPYYEINNIFHILSNEFKNMLTLCC